MSECIEREAAVALIEEKQKELCPLGRWSRHEVYGGDREKFDAWDEIINALHGIPAADVAPVVHGRWGDNGIPGSMLSGCSVCGFTCGAPSFRYCPNCGAKMIGGNDNG